MNSRYEDNTAWRRALRQEMVGRRAALTDAEHAALSARIVAHALAALARPKVCRFLLADQARTRRPDACSQAGQRAGVRAALPVVVAEDAPLRFREWTPDTRLAAGSLRHPDADRRRLADARPDPAAAQRLRCAPAIASATAAAISTARWRHLSPRPLAVGVGFEINRVDSIRPEPHDQRLDWIVTESGAFRTAA